MYLVFGILEFFHHFSCYSIVMHRVRAQLGLSVLVNQLQGLDLEGAPILFLAASSRTSETCFEAVQAVVKSVLDMVGVREQLTAMDHRQRGIMTYAAKSNHRSVFTKVCKLMKAQCKRTLYEEGEACMNSGRCSQIEGSRINAKWRALLVRRDVTGRTLLHHASEAGSAEVLEEVAKLAIDEESFEDMSDPDENGRTPMMHVLRNWHNDGVDVTEKKFDRLWESPHTRSTWMKERKIRSPENLVKGGRPDEERFTMGSTELLHAARGGPYTFALALEKSRVVKNIGPGEDPLGYIDDILEVKMLVRNGDHADQYNNRSPGPRTWGRALLLAAAARGGHVEALKDVVSAIKVSGEVVRASEIVHTLTFIVFTTQRLFLSDYTSQHQQQRVPRPSRLHVVSDHERLQEGKKRVKLDPRPPSRGIQCSPQSRKFNAVGGLS